MSFFHSLGHRIRVFINNIEKNTKWRKKLTVSGPFSKRKDTQIIISENGTINIGRAVLFQKNVSLSSINGRLNIGDNVSFNRNCIIICRNEISIENDVLFGPGVTIYDHDHVFSYNGILPGFKLGTVNIGKGCWIGANAIILRNTNIGENCVIGAGAIVKGDIPPHSLVVGEREMHIIPIRQTL